MKKNKLLPTTTAPNLKFLIYGPILVQKFCTMWCRRDPILVQKTSYSGPILVQKFFTKWCRKDPIFGAEDVLFRYQKSGMYSALLFPTGCRMQWKGYALCIRLIAEQNGSHIQTASNRGSQ